jgi:hypothetical protein
MGEMSPQGNKITTGYNGYNGYNGWKKKVEGRVMKYIQIYWLQKSVGKSVRSDLFAHFEAFSRHIFKESLHLLQDQCLVITIVCLFRNAFSVPLHATRTSFTQGRGQTYIRVVLRNKEKQEKNKNKSFAPRNE